MLILSNRACSRKHINEGATSCLCQLCWEKQAIKMLARLILPLFAADRRATNITVALHAYLPGFEFRCKSLLLNIPQQHLIERRTANKSHWTCQITLAMFGKLCGLPSITSNTSAAASKVAESIAEMQMVSEVKRCACNGMSNSLQLTPLYTGGIASQQGTCTQCSSYRCKLFMSKLARLC